MVSTPPPRKVIAALMAWSRSGPSGYAKISVATAAAATATRRGPIPSGAWPVSSANDFARGPRGQEVSSAQTRKSGREREPGSWGLAWGRLMTGFPIPVLVVSVLGLLALALPATGLRLGLPSNETRPAASTQHKSYELLTKGFGPGFNATLVVVVDGTHAPAAQRESVVRQVTDTVGKDPDIATVAPPNATPDGAITVLGVVPKTGPDDRRTTDLVHRLRDDAVTPVTDAGAAAYVAGATAAGIDVSAKLSSALPLFVTIIVVLALLLLMLAFRSILVPLKAVLGFALTIGVLIDAFVVRLTIVPAVLSLLGRHAWALPKWLDRAVPNVDIEGDSLPPRDAVARTVPATAEPVRADKN